MRVRRRAVAAMGLVLACALATGTGCGSRDDGDAGGRDAGGRDTGTAPVAPPPPAAADDRSSFATFWPRFRDAVVAGDTAALGALTAFPFRTRGPMDHDPVRTHDRAAFAALLPVLLERDPGLSLEPTTMRALVARTTAVGEGEMAGDGTARVGDFVFERGADGWRFAMSYVDEE